MKNMYHMNEVIDYSIQIADTMSCKIDSSKRKMNL